MSKLSALQGQSKKYIIGEIELELKPLGLDDMSLFDIDENSPMEKQIEATKKLISKTLKESVPDATDEEINGLQLGHTMKLMECVMDVNGMKNKANIKDVIKARQAQAKAAKTRP